MKSNESKTNSTKLTTRSTATKPKDSLDSAQVLSIIEACAKHGVTLLKFRDLELSCGPKAAQTPEPESDASNAAHIPFPDAAMSESKAPQQKPPVPDEPWEQTELELREEQIAELQLTDPLRAEEMIERGELDDADESGDDSGNE